jgi:peroxiredoxin
MERLWQLSFAAAWVLVSAHGLVLLAMLWALGRIDLRSAPGAQVLITDEGPELHTVMPALEGEDTRGNPRDTRDYRGRELVLLLLSPTCAPCEQLLRDLRGLAPHPTGGTAYLAILESEQTTAEGIVARYRLGFPVIADAPAALRIGLGVARTPYAFLIDAEGVVRMKGVVNNGVQLESLIDRRGQFFGDDVWQDDAKKRATAG